MYSIPRPCCGSSGLPCAAQTLPVLIYMCLTKQLNTSLSLSVYIYIYIYI